MCHSLTECVVRFLETMVSVDKQKNVEHVVAAGGNNTEYLDLAKKGGGHKGEWNDIFLWYAQKVLSLLETEPRPHFDTLPLFFLRVWGDQWAKSSFLVFVFAVSLTVVLFFVVLDLLTIDHHTPTPEPVTYDKRDGQWYSHDGVDVKETQSRRGK